MVKRSIMALTGQQRSLLLGNLSPSSEKTTSEVNKARNPRRIRSLSRDCAEMRIFNKKNKQFESDQERKSFFDKFTTEEDFDTLVNKRKNRHCTLTTRTGSKSSESIFADTERSLQSPDDGYISEGLPKSKVIRSKNKAPSLTSRKPRENLGGEEERNGQAESTNSAMALYQSKPPSYLMTSASFKEARTVSDNQSKADYSKVKLRKRCTLTHNAEQLKKIDNKYDLHGWKSLQENGYSDESFLNPNKTNTKPRRKGTSDLFKGNKCKPLATGGIDEDNSSLNSTGVTPKPLPKEQTKRGTMNGYVPSDLQNDPRKDYKRKHLLMQYNRDDTYFPFGKPGSGAPITDANTGKPKTLINGKFKSDFYQNGKDSKTESSKRKQMLDEQMRDLNEAEWRKREMNQQMRKASSSLDLVEKMRSFNQGYPHTSHTTRGSSDVTRQRLGIIHPDPLSSRLYSEQLSQQHSYRNRMLEQSLVEEKRSSLEHEKAMNSYFWKREGHGAPYTHRPTGNRKLKLETQLYQNGYSSPRQGMNYNRKSNSETDLTIQNSPRGNKLFWWLNNSQSNNYKLEAPFATETDTF